MSRRKKYDPFTAKVIRKYELDELTLSFIFDSVDQQIAKRYDKRTIFLAVTEDEKGNVVRFSNTSVQDP